MAVGLDRAQYVRMLSAVFAAMFLIRVAFGVTIVTFARYLTADDFTYSIVVTASPLLELLTVIFAGILIDRYGRKGILLTGLGLGAISVYGLALTKNVFILFLVNAIHGVAAALILVTTLAIIATYAPPERRGREMGFFNLANVFGWVAGFVLGALMLDALEGRLEYSFVIAGSLATLGLLYANRMLRLPTEQATARRERPPDLRELVRAVGNKDILLLTAPWLIVFMLVGAFITFFPRIIGTLDISGARTSVGILAVGALLMVSQYFWGRLADRHGRESIMLVGAIGFALLMGIIMFAFFETGTTLETQALESFDVDGLPQERAAEMRTMAGAVRADADIPTPVVQEVRPHAGPPGTYVVIEGTGFEAVHAVLFNGHEANFTLVTPGRLEAVVPGDATSGPIELLSPVPPQRIFANVMSHWALLTICLFLALAFAPAGLAAIADEAEEGAQGTTMSAYSLTLSLGFILGPPTVGFISETVGGTGMILYYAALAAGLLAMVLTRFVQARVTHARIGGGDGEAR